MPILTLPLQPNGPVVCVLVSASAPRAVAMQRSGQSPPEPVGVLALIDTGASCTAVDPGVIRRLGLTPSGTVSIHTPSTGGAPHTCQQFDVSIALLMHQLQVHIASLTLPVIEAPLAAQGIQALLGRDILSRAILVYNGHHGILSLAF